MRIYKRGPYEIWKMKAYTVEGYPPCFEYYVYGITSDPRVVPSEAMARELVEGL